MQTVFKKIIEKLEELADELYKAYCIGFNSDDRAEYDAYINAIEIVKQEAEKYNNGWIPVSERLPEEPDENPLFENKHLELYLVTTGYGSTEQDKVYPFRAFWNGVNFTDGWNFLDVIAWMELPSPYQPKGE